MNLFKFRHQATPDTRSHDFIALVNSARADSQHYREVQDTFSKLKVNYQAQQLKTHQ